MTLLKLFSKIVIIFPLFLWGLDTKFHITTDINLYSDKLYFDIFNHKWEKLPSNEPTNRAINFSKVAIYKNYQKFSIGYRYRSEGILEINKGFIETWYYASNDFNTLTKKSDIGYFISEPDIYGILNYYQMDSIFYKRFLKNNNSILSLTFNILRGKQLQYMEVKGNNEKDRFITDIDYYYTDKNLLLKNMEDDKSYGGYGASLDLEIKGDSKNNFSFSIGIYNILGFIDWKSITRLVYSFDSDTKYVGDDGYYHYKPFGVGQYFVNTDFHQKLPLFSKYSIKYLNIGVNGLYANNTNYNEIYFKYRFLKFGYVPETKNIIYGIDTKCLKIEISDNIKEHSKYLKLYSDIRF